MASAHSTAHGAIYQPERVQIMMRAFDAAWAHLQHRPDLQLYADAYRLKLADAVLAEAGRTTDPAALAQAALARLASA